MKQARLILFFTTVALFTLSVTGVSADSDHSTYTDNGSIEISARNETSYSKVFGSDANTIVTDIAYQINEEPSQDPSPLPQVPSIPKAEGGSIYLFPYRVQPGDNISTIGRQFGGISPQWISDLNGLQDSNKIYDGQYLAIPIVTGTSDTSGLTEATYSRLDYSGLVVSGDTGVPIEVDPFRAETDGLPDFVVSVDTGVPIEIDPFQSGEDDIPVLGDGSVTIELPGRGDGGGAIVEPGPGVGAVAGEGIEPDPDSMEKCKEENGNQPNGNLYCERLAECDSDYYIMITATGGGTLDRVIIYDGSIEKKNQADVQLGTPVDYCGPFTSYSVYDKQEDEWKIFTPNQVSHKG